jgi:ketosteroid isomerase-like protein
VLAKKPVFIERTEMTIQPFMRVLKVTTALGVLLLVGGTAPQSAVAASRCAPAATAPKEVVAAMEAFFVALRANDQQRFLQITTPDFFAYDIGKRLTGPDMLEFIGKAQASGKHFVWSVTEAEPHVECNLAWLTYVNQGSVGDESGTQPVTWLESAVMEYTNQRWRIRFIHSTRAAKAP